VTDVEWLEQVRKYAMNFGSYSFSDMERKRMAPFVTGDFLRQMHQARFFKTWRVGGIALFTLLDNVETGIVNSVTAKLTGGRL
jgi:hypothetical protein